LFLGWCVRIFTSFFDFVPKITIGYFTLLGTPASSRSAGTTVCDCVLTIVLSPQVDGLFICGVNIVLLLLLILILCCTAANLSL
jgi:hypothetical protein